MHVPEWFKRELKIIDPTYYVFMNNNVGYNYYEIRKDFHWFNGTDRTEHWASPSLANFKLLNNAALDSLRERKRRGLQFEKKYYEDRLLQEIKRENREIREKNKELALDMMAEGFIRIEDQGRRKMFT